MANEVCSQRQLGPPRVAKRSSRLLSPFHGFPIRGGNQPTVHTVDYTLSPFHGYTLPQLHDYTLSQLHGYW